MGISARQFQRAFDGLRSAIGEKYAVQTRPLRQFARQRALERIMKQIRDVNRAASFAPDHAHQSRMRITQRIYRDAAEKIEICSSV